MIRAAIVLVLVATGGCDKEEKANDFDSVFRTMKTFRGEACACKDRACAMAVATRMTEWAQRATTDDSKRPEPTSTQTKEMTVVSEDLSKCLTKLLAPTETPPSDAPAVFDAPSPIDTPPARKHQPQDVDAPVTADELLVLARTWARDEHEQLRITEIDVEYVAADGMLDPEHGRLTVELGRAPQIVDDSKRRTGAPVKPPPSQPTECMAFAWTAPKGWLREFRSGCQQAALPFLRCSIATIWKRAIEKGAPADAVAVLHVSDDEKPRYWSFSIIDEPRKVKINYFINDDCTVVLERP